MDNVIAANKALIEIYFNEAWNKGNLDALDHIIDPAYINHNPSTPNPPPGPAGLKPIIAAMRSGIRDLNYAIEDLIITPEKVVARVFVTGIHHGTLFGIPASGKHIKIHQINIEHIKNGKIAEHWRISEELKLLQQLGQM